MSPYRNAPVTHDSELTYHRELSLACTYALRRPHLARTCAFTALRAAVAMGRPHLAYRANALLGAL